MINTIAALKLYWDPNLKLYLSSITRWQTPSVCWINGVLAWKRRIDWVFLHRTAICCYSKWRTSDLILEPFFKGSCNVSGLRLALCLGVHVSQKNLLIRRNGHGIIGGQAQKGYFLHRYHIYKINTLRIQVLVVCINGPG